MISHGRPTEYCRLAVCETGFIHSRVLSSGRSVELRMPTPSLARSFVVDRRPPEETDTPASNAKFPIGLPGITARHHSDTGGVEEFEEDMPRGSKMLSRYTWLRSLPVTAAIARPSKAKPL